MNDELKLRIEQIDHARRQLGQSVDASGHFLRRALHRAGGAPPAEEPVQDEWPRSQSLVSRSFPVVAVVVLVSVVAVLVLFLQWRRPALQAGIPEVTTESPIARETVAVDRALTNDAFVVHVRAMRACRVRVVVDGTALDWRELQEGDEIVSRPREEMLIESSDAGALVATVNGRPVDLGPDRQPVAFHFTPDVLKRLAPD
jgi:Domain of unknown function (DUF4115)